MTKHWPVQEAKARFSEVLRAAETEPQHITYRGKEKGVLISAEEYRRLRKTPPDKTFYEIWKAAPRVPEFEIPRRKGRMRPVKL
jgi:prevent-host-death family protein